MQRRLNISENNPGGTDVDTITQELAQKAMGSRDEAKLGHPVARASSPEADCAQMDPSGSDVELAPVTDEPASARAHNRSLTRSGTKAKPSDEAQEDQGDAELRDV